MKTSEHTKKEIIFLKPLKWFPLSKIFSKLLPKSLHFFGNHFVFASKHTGRVNIVTALYVQNLHVLRLSIYVYVI